MTRVAVVVIGDLGRSPRMQYHCLSLAKNGILVDFIGYDGSECWPSVSGHANIKLHKIKPEKVHSLFKWNYYLEKLYIVLMRILMLLWIMLWSTKRPDYILVQTPPAVPILGLVKIISWIRWSKVIIDWHNYGFTILNISYPGRKRVLFYKWFEFFFGKGAYRNFCVSNAMKTDLETKWGISATALHDRPQECKIPNISTRHTLFSKKPYGTDKNQRNNNSTAFTKTIENNRKALREDRPALIVSSTSWTKDEDFDILLDALVIVEKNSPPDFPQIRVVVTGKGDQKKMYEKKIEELKFRKIQIFTDFLSYPDYVTLIGSADLGICLHKSSSKVDLPMKVVDMFGCHLPVCAYDYKALPELIKKGMGLLFKDEKELASQIQHLFKEFPNTPELDKMRKEIIKDTSNHRWDEEWKKKAAPFFGLKNLSINPE